jgi:RNA polymerase sigma factor (TIGR02999 family)
MSDADNDITVLLQNWQRGDSGAEAALVSRVYPLLRRLALQRLRRSETMTWQPTDLVGEIYVKLFEGQQTDFRNRGHFLAIAARVMRRVVADHFRERHAQKRGGGAYTVSLDDVDSDALASESIHFDLVEMDGLLDELAGIDARCADVVELRYFGGLTVQEAGVALGLSERTVKRSWQFARAWLHTRLDQAAAG